MVSKGLRTAFVYTVTEVEAGDNAPKTTETLINYTACYGLGIVHYQSVNYP